MTIERYILWEIYPLNGWVKNVRKAWMVRCWWMGCSFIHSCASVVVFGKNCSIISQDIPSSMFLEIISSIHQSILKVYSSSSHLYAPSISNSSMHLSIHSNILSLYYMQSCTHSCVCPSISQSTNVHICHFIVYFHL